MFSSHGKLLVGKVAYVGLSSISVKCFAASLWQEMWDLSLEGTDTFILKDDLWTFLLVDIKLGICFYFHTLRQEKERLIT